MARWLTLVACLLPPAALVILVQRFWINVPFGDQWELIEHIQLLVSAELSLPDLWSQHNEHRLFFPRAVMLGLAWASSWDTRYEMAFSVVVAAASFGALWLLIRRTFPAGRWWVPATVAVATSLVVFSPAQWENWLWGWQIQWFMNVFALLCAVVVLALWPRNRPAWQAVALGAVAALLGHYSLANGLFIWLACLPLLVFDQRYRHLVGVWVVAGGLSTAAYLNNYEKPGNHPAYSEFFAQPAESWEYVTVYLGRLYFENQLWASLAGSALLVTFLGLCGWLVLGRREMLLQAAPWLAVGFYALLSALVTAIGRAGFGAEQANSSRYTTIGLLFTLGTLTLFTLLAGGPGRSPMDSRVWPAIGLAPWLLVGALLVLDYPDQIGSMVQWHDFREASRSCLLAASSPDEPCLTLLYPPGGDQIFDSIGVLEELGWGPPAEVDSGP